MTTEAYSEKVLRYLPEMSYKRQMEYGLIGLCGESGEALDILKKAKYQGHHLDVEHLASELGDVLWYLNIAAHSIGYSLDDIMQINIKKLEKRFPEGYFSTHRSINRAEDDI